MSEAPGDILQKPPRSVPLNLRLALFSNLAVLIGGLVLAMGLFFSILFLSPGRVLGDLRLWFNSREARGIVVRYEPTIWSRGGSDAPDSDWERRQFDNDRRTYVVAFSFDLPDGVTRSGECFVSGRRVAERLAKSDGNNRFVAIEYVPSAPHISRIRNTRTSPHGAAALFLLLIPSVGAAITLAGIAHARNAVRLLRHGEAVAATIKRCRGVSRGGSAPGSRQMKWLSLEQFHKELQKSVSQAIDEHGRATKSTSFSAAGFGRSCGMSTTRQISAAEFKSGFRSFLSLFQVFLAALFVFWALLIGFILWVIWFGADTDLFERVAFTIVILLIAAFFVVFGILATRFLRRAHGAATGSLKLKELADEAECEVELSTSTGRTVKIRNRIPLERLPVDGDPVTALFDVKKPKRGQLLEALPIPVRVGPAGRLTASGTIWRMVRLAGVSFLVPVAIGAGRMAAAQANVIP